MFTKAHSIHVLFLLNKILKERQKQWTCHLINWIQNATFATTLLFCKNWIELDLLKLNVSTSGLPDVGQT